MKIFLSDIQFEIYDNIENKHSLYCGLDSMKKFGISQRDQAANVIKFQKKNMLRSRLNGYNCRKKFTQKLTIDKNYRKVRQHCHFTNNYRGAALSICNLRFNVSK